MADALFSGAELLDGLIVSHQPRAVKAYLQIGHQARGSTLWDLDVIAQAQAD
jgi:hypothetical protein